MLSASPLPKLKKARLGPPNELHLAVGNGSVEHTTAVLSRGLVDVDQGSPEGCTPLMLAASNGHLRLARILLNKGASALMLDARGYTAAHVGAERGHLAVTKLLVKAGSDLEAATSEGFTPLHLAAHDGHSEVMSVLIEAGANPNSRWSNGTTPLFVAAQNGHMGAVTVLLRAKADLRLERTHLETGATHVPLDMAAKNGHLEVVRELIRQDGIKGCCGARNGMDALVLASMNEHVDIMNTLTDAGVADTGTALLIAADHGREFSVKFLLRQREGKSTGEGASVNSADDLGRTPLACSILGCRPSSRRILRLLMDAGADTTSTVRLLGNWRREYFRGTPLALTALCLRQKKAGGGGETEEQVHRLEAMRRLLLRVEAVHALSWLWPTATPPVVGTAGENTGKTETAVTPLGTMLPLLRRRARRQDVPRVALFRYSEKI